MEENVTIYIKTLPTGDEATAIWTSTTTPSIYSNEEKSYTGLIAGLSVAAAVALLGVLVGCIIRKKYCKPLSVRSVRYKNGGVRSSEQDMFIIGGSNRNSQISVVGSTRASLQEHPINPVCSFDEYVDIDLSATIEQPNILQPELEIMDLQPASHNPIYERILNTKDENDTPDFLQENHTTDIRKPDKETVVINSKTRKLSLQEEKAKETESGKYTKKRNKSMPALAEYNNTDENKEMSKVNAKSNTSSEPNVALPKPEKRNTELNKIKANDLNNLKVSSLRSVLLEVDEYENIEIVNNQKKHRAGITSMKEKPLNGVQVPVRRAFSEQARAPVPQPRTTIAQKRKTFDPYDYPPGIPIPKALLEAEENADSEYIPHNPSAEEVVSIKRKTFDPYDYPPGVPIPRGLRENAEPDDTDLTHLSKESKEKLDNEDEYVFIENSGVYIAYDPENAEGNIVLTEKAGDEYVNCSDVVFEDDKDHDANNSDNRSVTPNLNETAINSIPGPPKPCLGPYYVNEIIDVFDTEHDTHGVEDMQIHKVRNSAKDNKSGITKATNETDTIILDKNDTTYGNALRNESQSLVNAETGSHRSDPSIVEPAHKRSTSETNTSKDTIHYPPDNGGIYQNLVPAKPPRLHNSLGKLENINISEPGNDSVDSNQTDSLLKNSFADETMNGNDYEEVLVMKKRADPRKDIEHDYVNTKRFS